MNRKYYDGLSRDLKKSAEENRFNYTKQMDHIQREIDFAYAKRVFWIGIGLVILSAIIQTRFI